MLQIEIPNCSPVQRDFGLLLWLHRFLIFASCDWCHHVKYNLLIVYLENT